jgi:glucan phosphoethanolaminetransferase (alkaline phosphatase superfamily)
MYWTIWLLMIPCNGLIKISAILLYRRIFLGTVKKGFFDILTKIMFVICLSWTVAFFFAQIFGCGTAFYKPFGNLLEVASCDTNTRLNALMISDLVTDILVWLTPLTVVWSLQMDVKKKLGVSAVLLLASASLVAAVIRLIVELQIADGGYAAHTDVDRKPSPPPSPIHLQTPKLTPQSQLL